MEKYEKLDLDNIKDKKHIIISTEEALKDVEPYFTENNINDFVNELNNVDEEYRISIDDLKYALHKRDC